MKPRRSRKSSAKSDDEWWRETRAVKAKATHVLSEWMARTWGVRCADFNPGCAACRAWYYHDYLLMRDRRGRRPEVDVFMALDDRTGDRIGQFIRNAIQARLAREDKALLPEDITRALYLWKDAKLVSALREYARVRMPPLPPRRKYKSRKPFIEALARAAKSIKTGKSHYYRHKDVFP